MSQKIKYKKFVYVTKTSSVSITILSLIVLGVLKLEATVAKQKIGLPFGKEGLKTPNIFYPKQNSSVCAEPLELLFLGDSLACGLGVEHAWETPAVLLSQWLANNSNRSVKFLNAGKVGAESKDLPNQVVQALQKMCHPTLTIIFIGSNDVTHLVKPATSVKYLQETIKALQAAGSKVLVATCPDLGTVRPIKQPLRGLAAKKSRDLAAAQTVAAVQLGACSISLADALGDFVRKDPKYFFSRDNFHPSKFGYLQAAKAILPAMLNVLGLVGVEDNLETVQVSAHKKDFLSKAAFEAVKHVGTQIYYKSSQHRKHFSREDFFLTIRRKKLNKPG